MQLQRRPPTQRRGVLHRALEKSAGRRHQQRALLFILSLLIVYWLLPNFGGSSDTLAASKIQVRVRFATELQMLTAEASGPLRLGSRTTDTERVQVRTQALGFLLLAEGKPPQVLDDDVLEIEAEGGLTLQFQSKGEARRRRCRSVRLIHRSGYGLTAIEAIGLEDYIGGVLEGEMGARFPSAALEAQAIAARSYVLSAIGRSKEKDYDVFADARSQVFRGRSKNPKILEAVRNTHGQILTYEGKPLRAYYHSTCGGKTRDGYERFRDVPRAPFVSTECLGCTDSPRFRWSRSITKKDWERLYAGGIPDRIEILRKSGRGDAISVQLVKKGMPSLVIRGGELRSRFGLPSTWIRKYSKGKTQGTIHGRGFGHGVGLCQYGARGYSNMGYDAKRILAHYFHGAKIERLPD